MKATYPPEQIERARELQRDGWTAPEIAKQLKMAESTVRERLPKFGKTARPHPKAKPKKCEGCRCQMIRPSIDGLCGFCQVETGAVDERVLLDRAA